MRRSRILVGAAAPLLVAACFLGASPAEAAGSGCQLANGIKHVFFLQFDNVHFTRDNPNVPSDLEQMPNLLNFIEDNGTLLAIHTTPLISHTSDDIITTLTGVYGEKHGQPVGNSYGFFRADGSVGFSSSFNYWTDIGPDGTPQMVDQRGKVHPAPWVPFTRAGCNVGAFSLANIEFENVSSDINNVFGANSPEAAEAKANFSRAVADFEGIAVHCAQGSPLCGAGKPDLLPDEPAGYVGFNALYGNKNVAPAITGIPGNLVVKDINGVQIDDGNTPPNVGFPGFDPSAAQTLGYAAQMFENGVDVVFTYISDTHDNHVTFSGSFGPGETGYVQQNAQYNDAFGKFFARLKADGITKENTLFIITADENDHFAGQAGQPVGCDGIHTPCTYIRIPAGCDGDDTPCTTTNLGEVDVDVRRLLITPPFNNTTAFSVHSDDAPVTYINGNPGQADPVTRQLERDMANLQAFDPIVNANVPLTQRLAGVAEMSFLHMITHDPARTPTFTPFDNDDFFVTASTKPTPCPSLAACSNEQPGFNWNHGDFQSDIVHTFASFVGPGVRTMGVNQFTFTDHTDVRPTMLSLAGLTDDYAHDGRVVFEIIEDEALPPTLRANEGLLSVLADSYKQINAPVGTLGLTTLQLSTTGLSDNDATFAQVTAQIQSITATRNAIGSQMIAILEGAAFANQPVDQLQTIELIDEADALLFGTPVPSFPSFP
jgi:hypothetical protein